YPNISIVGETRRGATFRVKTGEVPYFSFFYAALSQVHDLTIKCLVFDGNAVAHNQDVTVTTDARAVVYGNDASLNDNIKFQDNMVFNQSCIWVISTSGDGLVFEGNDCVGMGNVNATNQDMSVVRTRETSVKSSIVDNTFIGLASSGGSSRTAIEVHGGDNRIVNNTVDLFMVGVIAAAVSGDLVNSTILYNKIKNTRRGIVLWGADGFKIVKSDIKHNKIYVSPALWKAEMNNNSVL